MFSKKTFCRAILLVFVFFCAFSTCAEDVRLFVPEKIYAVPGVEMNVYFNNIVTVINPANYVFDVDCSKGRNDRKRWRFTPQKSDTGTYKWSLRVIGMNGVVARAEAQLIVLPFDAGSQKNITMLMVGASQTSAGYYADRMVELMKRPGNPGFKTIGSKGRQGKHEGYGGWGWGSFLIRWGFTNSKKMDGMHPDRPVGFNSPFLFPDENGKGKFDLQKYFDKYNNGKAPDVVSFQLGLNDFFSAKDHNIAATTANSIRSMEKLIAEFRKFKPAPEIMIFQHIPGSGQDSFGANYACGQTAWQYRKNLDFYNRELLKKGKELKVTVVPIYMNIDTENNFPVKRQPVNGDNKAMIFRQNNGVHPAPAGYFQMGDTLYCCLKALLHNKK